jgi:hypothetical protein
MYISFEVTYSVFSIKYYHTYISLILPLKPQFDEIILVFKNSVRTSKRTPKFTITKINW